MQHDVAWTIEHFSLCIAPGAAYEVWASLRLAPPHEENLIFLALILSSRAEPASNERRFQRFMSAFAST